MDAYSSYNQIPMHLADKEYTFFITNWGLYYYRVIPFGLKNTVTTYQRLVNKIFVGLIGKTIEVYIDDMLVKILKIEDHIKLLREVFQILRRYKMWLNPLKCAFGVALEKFLGYMVNQRCIMLTWRRSKLWSKWDHKKPKEVQSLNSVELIHLEGNW